MPMRPLTFLIRATIEVKKLPSIRHQDRVPEVCLECRKMLGAACQSPVLTRFASNCSFDEHNSLARHVPFTLPKMLSGELIARA
jgi:hypothetical protein